MPKKAKELTDAAVRKLTYGTVTGEAPKGSAAAKGKAKGEPCTAYHAVGGVSGLLLCCKTSGARSWILRTKVGSKRRDLGLGGYPDVKLSQARDRAREAKELIRQGIDPKVQREAAKSALIAQQGLAVSFSDVADKYMAKKAQEFKTEKQSYKLRQQLETYAYPFIGRMVVADIERAHIVKMLEPIWTEKHETASRVRLHVERVLDRAGVEGLRTGDNPARWRGNLDQTFSEGHKVAKRQHHNSLPHDDLPAFWRDLQMQKGMGPLALQFLILTAARPGEAREARWEDIDLRKKVWTIPDKRMKGGKLHRVPLTDEAVKLLKALPRQGEYLFPGPSGKPVSDVTMSKVPKALGHDVTAHGFRATFRTWTQEHTSYPEEVCELALAHVNSDATRAAYARSELIDKRRELMTDWEHFILNGHGNRSGKVVNIR